MKTCDMIDLREKIKSIIDREKAKNHFSVLDDSSIEFIQQIFNNYEDTNNLRQDMENIPKQAELIFVAAPTGAGKDSLVIKLNKKNPEKKYIELNIDIFRHYFAKFIPDVSELKDKTFAFQTNEFAYEIYFTIQEILITEFPGTNIIITGTLRETDWVEETFRLFKSVNNLTEYYIKLIALAVPKKESAYSVIKRYVKIVDSQINKDDFVPGTARYTSLDYHDETFERFPNNLQYFQNSFLKCPGQLIDAMEVYKRSSSIDDYEEDTLVYSSEREKYKDTDALTEVLRLRTMPVIYSDLDVLDLLNKVKMHCEYMTDQGIFGDLVSDLGGLLGYKQLVDRKEKDTLLK